LENSLQKAILKTLVYADIFDYPLNFQETCQFLITPRKTRPVLVNQVLGQLDAGLIGQKQGFYFLKDREKIVNLRKRRQKWSQEKMKIAQRLVGRLKLIPWLRMIGLSGTLAMENSDANDDIDFLIIASSGRLWLTRFFLILLLELFGTRRKPGQLGAKNKICPNIFLDEETLEIPKNQRNLFTAHEICQIKVLWEKKGMFEKFLNENCWVENFLANAVPDWELSVRNQKPKAKNHFLFFWEKIGLIPEKIAYGLQIWYMRKRKTREKVGFHQAFFHPRDLSEWVLEKYQKKCRELLISIN